MRCSKCGSDSPAGKKFCEDCGALLALRAGLAEKDAIKFYLNRGNDLRCLAEAQAGIGVRRTIANAMPVVRCAEPGRSQVLRRLRSGTTGNARIYYANPGWRDGWRDDPTT